MDVQALDSLLDRYSDALSLTRKDERYKWKAVERFKKNWDPEAGDFSSMLQAALALSANLLRGSMYYPQGMIEIFAHHFTIETKQALIALLDESEDLRARLVSFEKTAKELLDKENKRRAEIGEELAKNDYQDPRAMCVYLTFAHPEGHYLFKTSMYQSAAKLLKYSIILLTTGPKLYRKAIRC